MTFALAHDRARLLALLHERAYERRPVTLASGRTSSFYIDCKRVTLLAEGQWLVGRLLLDRLSRLDPPVVAAGGLTLGADPISAAVAMASWLGARPLDSFIVRKEPKAHGTGRWIEGLSGVPAGSRVAILEDVVTTGGSGLAACDRVIEAGFAVAGVFALVDRVEGGRAAFEARGLRLESLFTRDDLLQPGEPA